MKITRCKEGVKITLPPYKINIRKLTSNGTKNSYQYTCILPPLLCSFFEVGTVEPEDNYNNILMFMELKDNNIILSGNNFYKALNDQYEHNTLEMINNSYGVCTPNPELVQYCKDNPINFKLFDTVHYKKQYNSRVYKLSNSNSYRVTLPNQLFKPHIKHTENNYILFTIDTTKEDLQTNKGVVTYEIIN